MTDLQIEPFQPVEVKFLAEYLKIMKQVVDFLNIMQAEENIGIGYLLPSLYILENKLDGLKQDSTFQFCNPLVESLIESYKRRYFVLWNFLLIET